jgi:hypothetical protein
MNARLRAVAADESAVSELHDALRRRARRAVVAEGSRVRLLHDAGYLVERDRVDAFAAEVDAYGDAHPELNVVCTGPWAPASFGGAA